MSILPADRLAHVSEYYFSRKLKEIARLNASGADIISLGIGGPDLPPPVEAIDAAVDCLHRKDSHGYQMTGGLPELRAACAEWYGRIYGVRNLDP
ncbi:MAG: aminotransferase, partial [Muribaculaceae bacterium]|nr:aminotransferase [Muribaculaceae bacterium]